MKEFYERVLALPDGHSLSECNIQLWVEIYVLSLMCGYIHLLGEADGLCYVVSHRQAHQAAFGIGSNLNSKLELGSHIICVTNPTCQQTTTNKISEHI